jgi:hypothetical protein
MTANVDDRRASGDLGGRRPPVSRFMALLSLAGDTHA